MKTSASQCSPQHQLSEVGQIFLAAIQAGSGDEAIKALCQLKESERVRQEERELNAAMAEFQAKCPPVSKNKTASFPSKNGGEVSYDFVSLDRVTATIAPVASACGLSYGFDSILDGAKQIVTCTIRHIGGGSRKATFSAPVGGTTTMSDMQKGASALTYARRYSLLLAFGIGTADMDYDGANPPSEPEADPVTQQELTRLIQRVRTHIQNDKERYAYYGKVSLSGEPNHTTSWTREQFAKVCENCDEWENSGQ